MGIGDYHLSEQEGTRSALLVWRIHCYDDHCADVFSLLLVIQVCCSVAKTHQAHFVWLIGYPPVANAAPPRHQTSLIKFWCDPLISIFAEWLLLFLSPEQQLSVAHFCLSLIGSKIKPVTRNGTCWGKKKSFEEWASLWSWVCNCLRLFGWERGGDHFFNYFFRGNKWGWLTDYLAFFSLPSFC